MSEQKRCGLWEKESKDGRKYWGGKLGNTRFFLWPNNSENPNAPAYNLNIVEDEPAPEDNF